MPPKKTSTVWENFDKVGDTEVKCSLCSKIMAYHGSTSMMRHHLDKIHHMEQDAPTTPKITKFATSTTSERVFSKAGLIVSKLRSALSSSNVNALIFLAQNREVYSSDADLD